MYVWLAIQVLKITSLMHTKCTKKVFQYIIKHFRNNFHHKQYIFIPQNQYRSINVSSSQKVLIFEKPPCNGQIIVAGFCTLSLYVGQLNINEHFVVTNFIFLHIIFVCNFLLLLCIFPKVLVIFSIHPRRIQLVC